MSHSSNDQRAYNHHISGYGFLNRARTVPVRKGDDFLSVDVTALEGVFDGNWDDIEKTRYDCKVVGRVAKVIIARYMNAINERETTVMAAFKLGGCRPEIYVDKKTGEQRVSLKSRLLKISWLKIGDEVIYLEHFYAGGDAASGNGVAEQPSETSAYPDKVMLDPKADDFLRRKRELKEAGYQFDAELKAWLKPSAHAA